MLAVLYILFAVWLSVQLVWIFYKQRICGRFVITLSLLFYYAIPGIRHCLIDYFPFETSYSRYYGWDYAPTYQAFFAILLFYVTYCLCLKISIRKRAEYQLYIPSEQRKIIKISIALIVFITTCFMLYCSLFGGIRAVMNSIGKIRDGFVVSSNPQYEFIQKFYYNLCIYAPVLLFGYRKKEGGAKLLLLVAFVVTVLIEVSTGSRGAMLIFFSIFIISSINISRNINKTLKKVLQIGLLLFVFVVIYRPIIKASALISTEGIGGAVKSFVTEITGGGQYSASSFSSVMTTLLNSFEHYYISLETSLRMVADGTHSHNYFQEFWIMLTAPIPSLLLGIEKGVSLTVFNSNYIAQGKTAQIPPGVIASAYYSGGVVWIALYAMLVAYGGKVLERFYKRIKGSVTFANEYYVALLFFYFGFAISGDFATEYNKQFTPIILIILLRIIMVRRYNESGTQ